jgi:hypothetical protein
MNNEPVALKFPTMLRKMWSGGEVQAWLDKLPPLYTAPRELSDEEIDLIAKPFLENMEGYSYYGESLGISEDKYIEFARAILKKASEK